MSDRAGPEASADVPAAVAAGVRLFNRGRYLEAQELWEATWRDAPADERSFLEALVQLAGGLHLRTQRGGTRGAEHLLGRALATLEEVGASRHGVDVARLLAEFGAYHDGMRASRRPHRLLDAFTVPKIR